MNQFSLPQIPVKSKRYSVLDFLKYIVLISFLLYFGKTLLIPLSFAFLISFILFPICTWFERHRFSRAFSIFISITILIVLITAVVFLLFQQLLSFTNEWPVLKLKLFQTLNDLNLFFREKFNVSQEQLNIWFSEMSNNTAIEIFSFLKSLIYSSGVFIVLIILIPIFSALILYYRAMLVNVLCSLFPVEKIPVVKQILHQTVHTYYNFIRGMAIVYLIVGVLNSVGLLIIGVPHAILFGFIASILTFIPYIGIIIASLFPITISWVTYDSIWYPIAVIALFTFVQYLEANIIFPMAVSNRLKINTLITIIMIILGGILWGAAGMILFVPFIAIIKLIADNSEDLKMLSIFLGTKNK